MLGDIENSIAFTFVEEEVAAGRMGEEQAHHLKERYKELHGHVLRTYENEKGLLRQARQMNQDLATQLVTLDKTGSLLYEDNSEIGDLRRELMKATNEVRQAQYVEGQATKELESLETEKRTAVMEMEMVRKHEAEMMEPQLVELRREVKELQLDLHSRKNQVLQLLDEKRREEEQLRRDEETGRLLMQQCDVQRKALEDAVKEPEKMQQECIQIMGANRRLRADSKKRYAQAIKYDGDEQELRRLILHREEELRYVNAQYEKRAAQRESAERAHAARVATNEHSFQQLQKTEEHRLQLDTKKMRLRHALKSSHETMMRCSREKDKLVKQLQIASKRLRGQEQSLPLLERQAEDRMWEDKDARKRNEAAVVEILRLKDEVDRRMVQYLKAEVRDEATQRLFEQMQKEKERLQEDITIAQAEGKEVAERVATLRLEREARARDFMRARDMARRVKNDLALQEFSLLDNEKKAAETNVRQREFGGLYEVIKSERNKYVNLIQAAQQRMSEMRQKIVSSRRRAGWSKLFR